MLGTQTQSLSGDGEAPLLRSAHLSPFPCVAVPGRHGPSTENSSRWTRAPHAQDFLLAVLAVVVWAFWHIYFGTPLWTTLIGCAIFVLFLVFVTGFKPGNYLFYVDLDEAMKRSPRAGGYYEILILSIRTRFLNIELSRMLRAQIVHGALHKFRESKATEEEFTKAQQWLRDQDPEIDFDFKLREIREGEA